MNNSYHFDCACGNFEHCIRFTYDEDDDAFPLSIEIHLNQYLPWYKRVWVAARYVLGKPTSETDYDVWMLNPDDARRLRDMVDEVVEKQFDDHIDATAHIIRIDELLSEKTTPLEFDKPCIASDDPPNLSCVDWYDTKENVLRKYDERAMTWLRIEPEPLMPKNYTDKEHDIK